eukprot:XP_011674911.1 PREDICTED: uncharacterized protein LOC105443456 [Strongylocentrotus purpuratus]
MCLSSELSFCGMRKTSCTMDGFCLLYLLMILLMRSGDVETNPGPDRIVSEEEFIKLTTLIAPSYYHKLGVNLDISIAELGQIEKDSQNTSDALMTVFTRWRDKQPPGTYIRVLLAEELERSGLGSLSGDLLAGSLVLKRTAGHPSRRTAHETDTAMRLTCRSHGLIVSEREFFKLSKQIDPSYYKEVGINFDIPNAELGHIEKESHNTSDALMTVFTRWRDKQPPGTDIRALLAEGLKNSDLGSLSDELLAGSLVPNRTGENEKEIMSAACKKAFSVIDNVLLLQAANKH